MNSNQKEAQPSEPAAISDEKRNRQSMQNFKKMLRDLVSLFREAAQVKTVYFYWVNRQRKQFVLETKATALPSVVFEDRIKFEDHFLNDFKSLKEPAALKLGKDIKQEALNHYPGKPPVEYLTILPYIKNKETVAVTVVESAAPPPNEAEKKETYRTFIRVLGAAVDTFLEMSDLYEGQKNGWSMKRSFNPCIKMAITPDC